MLAAFLLSALALPVPDLHPCILEMLRFPTLEECHAAIADGMAHEAYWQARLDAGLCRHEQAKVEAYLSGVRDALETWRLLREMHYDARYQWAREHWWPGERERLLERLGPELYAAGVLPYPVAEHWRIEPKKKLATGPHPL